MPKIYEYFGLIFLFHGSDHPPVHVHVRSGECETIFTLIVENGKVIELKKRKKAGKPSLNIKKTKEAETLILKYADEILKKWVKFFVLKQSINCISITKKL